MRRLSTALTKISKIRSPKTKKWKVSFKTTDGEGYVKHSVVGDINTTTATTSEGKEASKASEPESSGNAIETVKEKVEGNSQASPVVENQHQPLEPADTSQTTTTVVTAVGGVVFAIFVVFIALFFGVPWYRKKKYGNEPRVGYELHRDTAEVLDAFPLAAFQS